MAKQLQLRKGTATEHNTFTGANGEVTVDTTNKTLRVHDGSTVGGHVVGAVEDTLTSDSASKGLSARQGKLLNTTKNATSVLSGVLAHGATIPLPSGYTEEQCKWIVSLQIAETNPHVSNNQGVDVWYQECFTSGRVVTARVRMINTSVGQADWKDVSANYIIIGVK